MSYFEILLVFFSLFFFCCRFRNKNGRRIKWPFVGMLPSLLKNHHRINDFIVERMENCSSTTLRFKGPKFTNMNILLTVDPLNVHHVLSKNFGNYPKGPKFREIFEFLGDGIFNTDSEIWQFHRKMAQSFLTHPQFHQFLVKEIWKKIDTGLILFLDHVSKHGLEIELPDLFGRFILDTNCSVLMDYDPRTLSIELPHLPFSKALHDIEKAILYRHILPPCVWKFQRWLGVGQEKTYREAWKIIDEFLYDCISRKREKMSKDSHSRQSILGNELGFDLITLYMDEVSKSKLGSNGDKFLRDTFLTFFAAGLETSSVALSWFFYALSKNPHVLSKIKEELDATIPQSKDYSDDNEIKKNRFDYLSGNFDELIDKLIYLHAAICESLRLYPPIAFQAKVPIEQDTLPSGHKVDSSMQVVINSYAMGRMKSIWGEDCNEFKPERWISEKGKIRHEPSYKFLAFNSGPRTCVGKSMSLTLMKAIVIAIISQYHLQPIEGQPIVPDVSFVLHMNHSFKVKVLSL